MTKKKQAFDFGTALGQLETLVERMEEGNFSLEESMKAFEQGIKLTRECQQALTAAEQKVEVLVQQGSSPTSEPLSYSDKELADTEDEQE
jgi:exodeoxyribonuclease VII small subunit